MAYYTDDNTEGYSAAELAMLNSVAERVIAEHSNGVNPEDYDAGWVAAAIGNSFYDDITEAELEAAVRKRLGL